MSWIFTKDTWYFDDKEVGTTFVPRTLYQNKKLVKKQLACPGTVYWANVTIDGLSGSGTMGVEWTGAVNPQVKKLPKQEVLIDRPNVSEYFIAPMEAFYASFYIYMDSGRVTNAFFIPLPDGDVGVLADIDIRGDALPNGAIGVNCNYLTDNGEARKPKANVPEDTDYTTMLKRMNVRSLRYPGGEKSDYYMFAPPPFRGPPQPTLTRISAYDWPSQDPIFFNANENRWKIEPMDFKQFMDICYDIGPYTRSIVEPHLVLAWDSANRPRSENGTYTDEETLKAHAKAWAEYVARNYPDLVHYFEFGNECYENPNDSRAGNTAQHYATNFNEVARALKPINPNLRIGANGPSEVKKQGKLDKLLSPPGPEWWPTVMGQCSQVMDFMVIHSYPIWAWDYNDYERNAINLAYPVMEANAAIDLYAAPDRKNVIRIRVTETAPIDYCPRNEGRKFQWQPATLGHALVMIDLFASTLMQPRVDSVIFWNTNWKVTTSDPDQIDQMANNSVTNAKQNETNKLTAMGNALSFLGFFFRDGFPVATYSSVKVKIWAMKVAPLPGLPPQNLRIVMLNKTGNSFAQRVNISGFRSTAKPVNANPPMSGNNIMYIFTGNGINDEMPGFIPNPPANWTVAHGAGPNGMHQLTVTLLPYSATAFELLPDVPQLSKV